MSRSEAAWRLEREARQRLTRDLYLEREAGRHGSRREVVTEDGLRVSEDTSKLGDPWPAKYSREPTSTGAVNDRDHHRRVAFDTSANGKATLVSSKFRPDPDYSPYDPDDYGEPRTAPTIYSRRPGGLPPAKPTQDQIRFPEPRRGRPPPEYKPGYGGGVEPVHAVADLENLQDITVHLELPVSHDFDDELEEFSQLKRIGNFRAAETLFNRKLADHLGHPYVFVQYAELLLEMGDYRAFERLDATAVFGNEEAGRDERGFSPERGSAGAQNATSYERDESPSSSPAVSRPSSSHGDVAIKDRKQPRQENQPQVDPAPAARSALDTARDREAKEAAQRLELLKCNWRLLKTIALFMRKGNMSAAWSEARWAMRSIEEVAFRGGVARLGSTEVRIITLSLDIFKTLYPMMVTERWLDIQSHILGFVDWQKLYSSLLVQGRIWDFRDVFLATVGAFGMDDAFLVMLSEFHFEGGLRKVLDDWASDEQDESTNIALLDILTSVVRQQSVRDFEKAELQSIFTASQTIAERITMNQPKAMRSRPYCQWILAKVAEAEVTQDQSSTNSYDALIRHFENFPGACIDFGGIVRNPVYVPRASENPGWSIQEQPPDVVEPIQMVLSVARDLRDYELQVLCLDMLTIRTRDPSQLFDELAHIQKELQGDLNGHLSRCLTRYVTCKDVASEKHLLDELRDTEDWHDGYDLRDARLYWARDFIERALTQRVKGARETPPLRDVRMLYYDLLPPLAKLFIDDNYHKPPRGHHNENDWPTPPPSSRRHHQWYPDDTDAYDSPAPSPRPRSLRPGPRRQPSGEKTQVYRAVPLLQQQPSRTSRSSRAADVDPAHLAAAAPPSPPPISLITAGANARAASPPKPKDQSTSSDPEYRYRSDSDESEDEGYYFRFPNGDVWRNHVLEGNEDITIVIGDKERPGAKFAVRWSKDRGLMTSSGRKPEVDTVTMSDGLEKSPRYRSPPAVGQGGPSTSAGKANEAAPARTPGNGTPCTDIVLWKERQEDYHWDPVISVPERGLNVEKDEGGTSDGRGRSRVRERSASPLAAAVHARSETVHYALGVMGDAAELTPNPPEATRDAPKATHVIPGAYVDDEDESGRVISATRAVAREEGEKVSQQASKARDGHASDRPRIEDHTEERGESTRRGAEEGKGKAVLRKSKPAAEGPVQLPDTDKADARLRAQVRKIEELEARIEAMETEARRRAEEQEARNQLERVARRQAEESKAQRSSLQEIQRMPDAITAAADEDNEYFEFLRRRQEQRAQLKPEDRLRAEQNDRISGRPKPTAQATASDPGVSRHRMGPLEPRGHRSRLTSYYPQAPPAFPSSYPAHLSDRLDRVVVMGDETLDRARIIVQGPPAKDVRSRGRMDKESRERRERRERRAQEEPTQLQEEPRLEQRQDKEMLAQARQKARTEREMLEREIATPPPQSVDAAATTPAPVAQIPGPGDGPREAGSRRSTVEDDVDDEG